MTALFTTPKQPKFPSVDDKELEEERRKQLAARQRGVGRASTILTGGSGVYDPVLGSAAILLGGF